MKHRLFVFLSSALLLFPVLCLAEYGDYSEPTPNKDKCYVAKCPRIGITNDILECVKCHSLDQWKLKEIYPQDYYAHNDWLRIEEGEIIGGYYLLQAISADRIKKFLDYIDFHKVKHVTIEIQSTGGGLAEVWRVVGLLRAWQSKGGIVQTQVHGIALSAGFLTFVSGTKGHRFVSPTAELMWHELQGWPSPGITTPSDKEDEAEVYRHLQDTANKWIATRGNVSKEDLDEKVEKKEFWLSGAEAFACGFADGFIGESGDIEPQRETTE